MFAPGQTVGPYRLVSLLGQGGSGQVWEATLHGAHGFRKAVALKLLPGGPDDQRRAARIREARLGALLHHPNWVTTYDLGERGDTLFIAMELVQGPACASFVTGIGGLPPRVVLDLGVQAAAALEHIHRLVSDATPNGLVHGDVKPSNLLLDRATGLLKITDLGISVALGEEAAASGTPGYVAPERVKRLPFDGRSDLFGLGATLCALATGVRPFGTGVAAMAAAFHVEAVLEKGSLLGRVDAAVPGLGEIVRRCLRADPADRWASAAELGDALGLLATTTYGGEPGLIEWLDALPPEPSAVGVDEEGGTDDDTRPTHAVFVGREAEMADLCGRLRGGERLVTVVGLGGAGKTRLAQQVALTVRDAYPGGTWFVDLTEARTPNGACFAVARELGIEIVEGDPVRQVGSALSGRGRALFVLDNLEQLVDHAPACVGAWAAAAPEASFLVTSRVALRIDGEHQLTLGGLARADGCALFQARVGRALEPREQQDLERLVDELDGLPLAVELAAARSRNRWIDARDPVDDGAARRPARHQSLTASLDASWALLTPWASGAAGQLTVFEGGARLEAAEAILRAPPDTPAGLSVVDALQELLDASLVRWEPTTERFVMSPLVAVHARSRTDAAELAAAEVRHGAYFAQLGSAGALRALESRGGTERWRALTREVDNLTVAMRRAIARDDGDTAAGCALALDAVLTSHGPVQAAVEVLEDALELRVRQVELRTALGRALTETDRYAEADRVLALALTDAVEPRARAAALHARGVLELQTERITDAERTLSSASELYRAAGDPSGQAMVLRDLGIATSHLGRVDEAVGRFEEALRLAREARSRRVEALVMANLALVHTDRGDLEQALAFHHRALAVFPRLGARRAEAKSMANLALTLSRAGRLTEAIAWGERSVAAIRTTGDRRARAGMLSNLANALASIGRLDDAVTAFDDAIELHRALGDRRFEGISLGNLAAARLEQGRDAEAEALLERALALHRAVGNRLFEAFALGTLGVVWSRAGRHADAAAAFDAAAVLAEVSRDKVQRGLWTTWRGLVDAERGDLDAARAALAEAEPSLTEPGSLRMVLASWVVRARTEAALGESPAAAVDRAVALAAALGLDRGSPALAQLPA